MQKYDGLLYVRSIGNALAMHWQCIVNIQDACDILLECLSHFPKIESFEITANQSIGIVSHLL